MVCNRCARYARRESAGMRVSPAAGVGRRLPVVGPIGLGPVNRAPIRDRSIEFFRSRLSFISQRRIAAGARSPAAEIGWATGASLRAARSTRREASKRRLDVGLDIGLTNE